MRQKIYVLIMMLMIGLSTIVILPNDLEVEATGGGGGGEGESEDIDLDYDYIWDVINNLADVVHKDELWGAGDEVIRKGRGFGTKGDNWTAYYINTTLDEMGLDPVEKIPLKTLPPKCTDPIKLPIDWNCDLKVETIDFNLTINNPNWDFTDDGHIPKNETGVMPCASINNRPWTPGYWTMDYNTSFTNATLVPKDFTEDWKFFGASAADYYNVSDLTVLTLYPMVCGNATYIAKGESLPEDQDGRVFIFDEEEGCNEQLENVTNASGVILIHDTERGYREENYDYTNSTTQIVRINNESNLTTVIELLQNGTNMIVDNLVDNETLTFMHNFSHLDTWWPDEDFFIIGGYSGAVNKRALWTRIVNVVKRWFGRGWCHGFIAYFRNKEINNVHIMESTKFKWRGGGSTKEYQKKSLTNLTFPRIQIFSLNRSVGKWLEDNASTTTVSGYFEQRENNVVAYNVVGNLSINESPNDAIVILSSRYDSWWGECPGDSGAGTAIIMGIAKYFKDYNITAKYNLSFLFTTGEEYFMRGSWHYSLTHPQKDYNIIRWIGTDQLGYTQPEDSWFFLKASCKNEIDRSIISVIANESGFESKTGTYVDSTKAKLGMPNTDDVAWLPRSKCNTTVFYKYYKSGLTWNRHHTTGVNYAEGDSMKYMNRSEVNVTFELIWDVVKYYTVNPDCWIPFGSMFIKSDSDDADNLKDTILVDFGVKSILPHDPVWVNISLERVGSGEPVMFNNVKFNANRSEISKNATFILPETEPPGYYRIKRELYNSTGQINEIVDFSKDNTNVTTYSSHFFLYPYNYGLTPPNITNVTDTPDPIGYGFNVTISADVTSDVSTIDTVTVNVTYPDDSLQSFTMSNTVGDTYEYVFNDTWQHGEYEYGIWAKGSNGNESGSPVESFNVSAQATISVCTVKDSYGDNEWINLTDPPVGQIGYEFLDDGEVLRIWNKYDSYYFNTSNGIQFSNHYNEYWSTNVLMLGYYNNDVWNLIYRTDELSGFNKDIDSDGNSFVDATLWKNLSYGGYDFRLAVRYHLGVDDNELTVIPYIKNIDTEDIPYNLGFAWEINDIQIDMTPQGDYIEIDGTSYYLNQELDETYTNMAIPCFYIKEDKPNSCAESLYLRWDSSLNYKIKVKSGDGQYNAPVTLGIKIGTLSVGQEKYTELFWHDASEVVYYFDGYDPGEAWATNPGNMVDGSTSNYASTPIDSDVEFCHNSTCNGEDLGTISKVEIRAFGYWSGMSQRDIILRPVFYMIDGDNHQFWPLREVGGWSPWFDITNDNNAPDPWDWIRVKDVDCDVESGSGMGGFTLYCSKVEIRVTYNVNYAPGISNPYPYSGSTGVGIAPMLSITVYDPEDNMNISWLSNSSGSWQVFGTNNSVGNGTYHQVFTNASVNGQWWYWKVNVTDGSNYNESSVYKFYTGDESKITNTGPTNIKGYLLIQVQYYNTSNSTWVVADDTVNETSPRTIMYDDPGPPGQQILALDTIFNGLVNTSNLSGFGNGTYRVYAVFRDPSGNVLVCDDETELIATYEFTVTYD